MHQTASHFESVFEYPMQGLAFFFGLVNAGVVLRGFGTGTWAVLTASPIVKAQVSCAVHADQPADPGTRQAVAHPRPLRRTRALLAVPRVVLRHRFRHWISHADRPW